MFSELAFIRLIDGEHLGQRSCVLVNRLKAVPPYYCLSREGVKKIELPNCFQKLALQVRGFFVSRPARRNFPPSPTFPHRLKNAFVSDSLKTFFLKSGHDNTHEGLSA